MGSQEFFDNLNANLALTVPLPEDTNMKKIFSVLMVVLMLGTAGTAVAGDRYGGGRNDYRGGHHSGHHHGGRDAIFGAVIGGIVAGAIINAQRQQGYYQQQCWMESRPLYDANGWYVTNQWVQVCP